MSYSVAGIDVHKKKLAVVVADLEVGGGEYQFEQRWYGSHPEQLRALAEWLIEQQVEEVVESTAQYWRPAWGALQRYWKPICQRREDAGPKSGTLDLVQALSNRGRRGRKKDFVDAERLIKRLLSQELTLSFVPDSEQRLWRTVTRTRYQLTCNRVRLQKKLRVENELNVECSVILISACQDNQIAMEGNKNGLFTETLLRVWNNEGQRWLPSLQERNCWLDAANSSPKYTIMGHRERAFEHQRPFMITMPRSAAAA